MQNRNQHAILWIEWNKRISHFCQSSNLSIDRVDCRLQVLNVFRIGIIGQAVQYQELLNFWQRIAKPFGYSDKANRLGCLARIVTKSA
jgi:hypothetical protein